MQMPLFAAHSIASQQATRRRGGDLCRLFCLFRPEMPNAGGNKPRLDPVLGLAVLRPHSHRREVVFPRFQISATAEIRRKKHLSIDHTVGRAYVQHCLGQSAEIVRRLQHRTRRFISLQEFREILPDIATIAFEDAR